METLKCRRLHPNAILPTRGSEYACGLDIYSVEACDIDVGQRRGILTGLSIEIPRGFYGRLAPRSGLALKLGIDVMAGVVDPDYRGELVCVLINLGQQKVSFKVGDRIAQLVIEKVATLKPVWDQGFSETLRNDGAFGSTGE